jgi:hypothetical protein
LHDLSALSMAMHIKTPYPQGLSNGSEAAPKPLPVFGGPATGVCVVEADVQPPKSSSAATMGCADGLLVDDVDSPHPPDRSLAVICSGGLPKSTFDCACLTEGGSGAPQGLLSVADDPHGSNIAVLFCDRTGTGGFVDCSVD